MLAIFPSAVLPIPIAISSYMIFCSGYLVYSSPHSSCMIFSGSKHNGQADASFQSRPLLISTTQVCPKANLFPSAFPFLVRSTPIHLKTSNGFCGLYLLSSKYVVLYPYSQNPKFKPKSSLP